MLVIVPIVPGCIVSDGGFRVTPSITFPDPLKTPCPQGVGCRKIEPGSQIRMGVGMSECILVARRQN